MVAVYETDTVVDLTPTQYEIYNDDNRFIVFIAGRGVGKGWSVCNRMIRMIEDGTIRSGALILVMAPTYPQLKIGAIRTFDKLFGAAGLILEKVNGNEPERRLIRGITVIFRNASNPEQTRGGETQIVWLDEAAQMPDGVLTLTNANNRQFGANALYQTFITTTPRGKNWIWRDFFNEPTLKFKAERISTYHMTTEEAVEYGIETPEYLEDMGYVPGTDMYKQEILGEFNSWSGLVFAQYNAMRHSPDPFILPKFKTVYGGIDVGYTISATAMILSGITEQGAIYTFKEYYGKRAAPHEWMKLAAEWTREFHVKRWYVDSAANGEIAAMKAAGLPTYPSMKAKDATGTAVGFINGKLAQNQMFIDKSECPFLVSEIESYSLKEQMTGDEVTFLDKVKPNQPDHCFVAGTMVVTERGEIPIEQVVVGDYALTRKGFRRVYAAARTANDAEIVVATLSTNKYLAGTGNHPIWVENKGWTRLDQLMLGDTLLSCHDQNPSPSTASSSDVIPTPQDTQIASTTRRGAGIASAVWGAFTRKFGRSGTDARSPKGTTSITWTSTQTTTSRKTSSVSQGQNILPPTENGCENEAANQANSLSWNESGRWQPSGTVRTTVALGTGNMGDWPIPSAYRRSVNVHAAELSTRHLRDEAATPSALPSAVQQIVDPLASMTSNEHAPSAVSSSPSTDTANPDAAPVSVVDVYAVTDKYPVYNLSVEDEPEFYAQGVLVHNCIDSWKYHVLPLSSALAYDSAGCPIGKMSWSAA